MAKAKACDRCGTLYLLYNHEAQGVPPSWEIFNGFSLMKENRNGTCQKADVVDLCPDCADSLYRWYRGVPEKLVIPQKSQSL